MKCPGCGKSLVCFHCGAVLTGAARHVRISMMLTEDEKKALDEEAARTGKSRSAILRDAINVSVKADD